MVPSNTMPRTIAAIFMTLLVAWNTAEFAFQPVRRPVGDEIRVFVATALVMALIPFVRSSSRWSGWAALVIGVIWCIFGTAGLFLAGANEGFGKVGPAVAAVLMLVATISAVRIVRER